MLSQQHLQNFNRPYIQDSRSPDFVPPQAPYDKVLKIPEFPSGHISSRNQTLSRIGENIITSPKRDLNSFTMSRRFGQNQSTPTIHKKIDLSPEHFNNSSLQVASPHFKSMHPINTPSIEIGYGGVDRAHFDLNPIITSNHYREKLLKPIPPPKDKIRAVFAIYYLGFGYDSASRSFGKPNGLGFLLNEHLCITAHSVIPDEVIASASYAQFRDGEVFKFDPKRCFLTDSKYEFTVLAFQHQSASALRYIKAIHITEPFEFHKDDAVHYFPFDAYEIKKVTEIFTNYFTFASGRKENIVPGTPIFNSRWVLQGMYVRSSSYLNTAVRMAPILSILNSLNDNQLIDQFLHMDHIAYLEKFNERFLFYFEWHGRNVWRFDTDKGQWDHITLRNFKQLEDEDEYWSFHWNSRLVYLPSASILIIGGRSKTTGNETKEVWMFSPEKNNTLSKFTSMLTARESVACVYVDKFVYVIGGKPGLNSCERVSISSRKWQSIAPMYYVRQDAAACTGLDANYIFVFGGLPLNPTGNTIERYSIKINEWDLLTTLLPRPMARLAVFPITNRQIAILGGSSSHWIFMFKIEDNVENLAAGHDCNYKIEDCRKTLPEITETVYPVALSRKNNKIFILNAARSGYNGITPGVVEFAMAELDVLANESIQNGRETRESYARSLENRVRTPISIQRHLNNN